MKGTVAPSSISATVAVTCAGLMASSLARRISIEGSTATGKAQRKGGALCRMRPPATRLAIARRPLEAHPHPGAELRAQRVEIHRVGRIVRARAGIAARRNRRVLGEQVVDAAEHLPVRAIVAERPLVAGGKAP